MAKKEKCIYCTRAVVPGKIVCKEHLQSKSLTKPRDRR